MKRLVLCLLFAACSPMEQTFHDPVTEAEVKNDTYTTIDDKSLPLKQWQPKRKVKGVVVALHGFNDYSNAFVATGEYLKKKGYATYAYDQRGFGASTEPGIWAGEKNLVRDAVSFVQAVSKKHPKKPIFLLGESMGGAVAILASQHEDMPELAGVILVAPAVWGRENMNPLYSLMLWSMVHIMPSHTFTGRDLKILATNNIPVLRRISKDPLIIKATRVDAIYGIVNLMDHAYMQADTMSTPVLLLYGGQDQVIPPRPVESVVRRLPKPFTVGYYEDGYHMLTRDIQRDLVLSDIAGWMGEQAVLR